MARLFHGSPQLLVRAAPWAIGVLALKAGIEAADWHPLTLSPLLASTIAAEVFILGFLLSGTAADFKEAEHLPGELASSLETVADECLIVHQDLQLPEADGCLRQLVRIGDAVTQWLMGQQPIDRPLAELRGLNPFFSVFAPKIQAGFTTRLKSEQASMRKVVLRMDTLRRTSYVAAAYLIAELTAIVLVVLLLLTDLGDTAPTLAMVALVTYLLFYVLHLLRDLDNPFEYADGRPGAADVSLDVLDAARARLHELVGGNPVVSEHSLT